MPILPADRDPALITVRLGGTLTDDDQRMLATWAVACAEHVLPRFEGEVPMKEAHRQAFRANAAGRGPADRARIAVLVAGQAVAVPHVAAPAPAA